MVRHKVNYYMVSYIYTFYSDNFSIIQLRLCGLFWSVQATLLDILMWSSSALYQQMGVKTKVSFHVAL